MSQQWRDQINPGADEAPPDALDIVRDILDEVESLPRLIEVHYLMREPGLLDILRALAALSGDDRSRFEEYLSRHHQGGLRARELPTGALILESADETRLNESA